MFCYKCGKQIREDSVFCSFCGANVKENPNHLLADDLDFKKKAIKTRDRAYSYLTKFQKCGLIIIYILALCAMIKLIGHIMSTTFEYVPTRMFLEYFITGGILGVFFSHITIYLVFKKKIYYINKIAYLYSVTLAFFLSGIFGWWGCIGSLLISIGILKILSKNKKLDLEKPLYQDVMVNANQFSADESNFVDTDNEIDYDTIDIADLNQGILINAVTKLWGNRVKSVFIGLFSIIIFANIFASVYVFGFDLSIIAGAISKKAVWQMVIILFAYIFVRYIAIGILLRWFLKLKPNWIWCVTYSKEEILHMYYSMVQK